MDEGRVDFDPFRGGEIARTAPSTEPQREIIASAMMSPDANTSFNEALSLRIHGAMEPRLVEAALSKIVERHDALRMTFTRTGDQVCVTDENRFSLEVTEIGCSGEEAQERRIQELWLELAGTPMDLFDGPLFRAVFIQRDIDDAELILLAHHAVCDGWSFYLILNELAAILSEAAGELEKPATSFAEFAERQAAQSASNADIDFWMHRFKDLPPPMDLPTDRPRPLLRTFRARRTDFTFDSELTKAIRATAGKTRSSVVNVALAGVAVLLQKLCKVDDLVIALPVARQSTDGLQDLVGHGVQLLPIRLHLHDDDPFSAIVTQAKSAVLNAQEHPDFTFGTLIRELGLSGDGSRVPLISVIFNIDQPMKALTLGNARADVRSVPRVAENFEIFLNVTPTSESLGVEATYNTDLFDEGTVRAWLAALRSILADVADDPQKPISNIEMAGGMPEHYERLNATSRPHASDVWLQELARHCDASPEAPAVSDASNRLSYADLDRKSSQLARLLMQTGIGKGDLVGLYLNRSVDLVVAVAAVHRANAAYVPLDPAFPASRIAFMLEDSGAKLVLSNCELPAEVKSQGTPHLELPASLDQSVPGDLPAVSADDLAYVMYTSGTTGKPKGVRVHHGAVANFLHAMAMRPGMTASDRLLAVTTLSFDISVLELLLPPFCGASVYVATREQTGDISAMAGLLSDERITVLQATPATWRLLLGSGWKGDRTLKALCGGEALSLALARRLVAHVESLWNMYGPTETTVWSTCRQVSADCERITIGTPIDNTQAYILNDEQVLLPIAMPGELCIGGAGVAKGYVDRPELTGEKFIRSPEFGLLYRTGDRARLLPNGEIEHLGRIDDQVKVRGFRIELGEIEAVLQDHPDIERAAAHVWNVKDDDCRIVVCCVPGDGKTIAPIQLRKHLRSRLPEYMIPQHFLSIAEVPLTPNGKIDRGSLPVPVVADSRIGRHDAPATPVEAAIAEIWQALVRPERPIGREDRFFDIGGHSLLGLEALMLMEERLGRRLDPRILFQANLAGIATKCSDTAETDAAPASRPVPLSAGNRRLLSDNQELIYGKVSNSPESLQFHVPFSFKMTGALDVSRFETSLRDVFSRHAALRTVIGEDRIGPHLVVKDLASAYCLEHRDLSAEQEGSSAAMDLMVGETRKPFDIRQGPLVRMLLIRLSQTEHVFFFMPHQLIFDGWSFDLFLRDLTRHYTGSTAPEPAPVLEFADYSTWQRNRSDVQSETPAARFWKAQLRELPESVSWPVATSHEPKPMARVQFTVSSDRIRRYEDVCKRQSVKLSNFLLAAFVKTLAAAAARNDILIGIAASGRVLPEVASVIGPFYRRLPLRVRLPEASDPYSLLQLVDGCVEKITEFQEVTTGMLAELSGSADIAATLNGITFSFQEARNRQLDLHDIKLSQISVSRPEMEAGLEFWVRNTPDCLIASLDYQSDLADRELIEAIRDDYVDVLEALAEGGTSKSSFKCQSRLAGESHQHSSGSKQGGRGLLSRFGKNVIAG